MKHIGIDVGGTNTDAVFVQDNQVLGAVKSPTTSDVTTGVRRALAALIQACPQAAAPEAVMIGTTHFTNAVVQRRDLEPAAALRVPAGRGLAAVLRLARGPGAEGQRRHLSGAGRP